MKVAVILIILLVIVISLWSKRAPYDRVVKAFGSQTVTLQNVSLFSVRRNRFMKIAKDEDIPFYADPLNYIYNTWVKTREEGSLFNIELEHNSDIGGFKAKIRPVEYQSIYMTFDTNTERPEPIFSRKNTSVYYPIPLAYGGITYPSAFLYFVPALVGSTTEEVRKNLVSSFRPTFDGYGYKPCVVPSDQDETCVSSLLVLEQDKDQGKLQEYIKIAKSLM